MQEVEARWIVEQTNGCKTVLELGYGAGIVTRALVGAGKHVTTVDGSVEFGLLAAADGAVGVTAMFENYPTTFKFDCVIASFVLEHVADPIALLKRCSQWSDKLIVVVGNANSYHRQLAVQMGLQPKLDTLSTRDEAVGHYLVYDWPLILDHLTQSGWLPQAWRGIMLKPLPNSMMTHYDEKLIRAMCEIDMPVSVAANIGIVCK